MSDGTQGTDALADFLPPPEAPPQRKRRRWRSVLLYFLGGGLSGWLLARAGFIAGSTLSTLPAGFLFGALAAGLLMLWPHIVLHEAGHALAGLSRGMRPIACGIGALRWERGMSSGWRFRRGGALGGISGFVALVPAEEGRGLSRTDQALYLAGGPLANLGTAALAFALFALADPGRGWAAFLLGTGVSAAFVGLLNLVPFHAAGWRSDGRGLLDLLLRTPDGVLHQQVQQLLALSMAGVRPRDWPAPLIPGEAGAQASPMLGANGDLLRLSWAMDRRVDAAAAQAALHLTGRYRTLPEALRPHVAVALAGHAARTLHDHRVLAAWRPLCEGGLLDLSLPRAWLDAELLAAGGHDGTGTDSAVMAAIARARALLDRAPDPVTALLLREYLDQLAARIAADPAAPSPG